MRNYALHSNREICWDVYGGSKDCPKDHRFILGLMELHEIAAYFRAMHSLEVDAWETSVHVSPRGQASLSIMDDGSCFHWELLSEGLPIRSGELDTNGLVLVPAQLDRLAAMLKRFTDALLEIDFMNIG